MGMLKGLVDFDKEVQKLEKELKPKLASRDKLQKARAVPTYVEKVPEKRQEEDRLKLEELLASISNIEAAIEAMKSSTGGEEEEAVAPVAVQKLEPMAYLEKHQVQAQLSAAANEAVKVQPEDPLQFISQYLA